VVATRTRTIDRARLAREIEAEVRADMAERYGLFLTEQDSFDLTEDGQILLVNSAGHTSDLPTTQVHAEMIAAAMYFRDGDS
jgi:hypothetical protein